MERPTDPSATSRPRAADIRRQPLTGRSSGCRPLERRPTAAASCHGPDPRENANGCQSYANQRPRFHTLRPSTFLPPEVRFSLGFHAISLFISAPTHLPSTTFRRFSRPPQVSYLRRVNQRSRCAWASFRRPSRATATFIRRPQSAIDSPRSVDRNRRVLRPVSVTKGPSINCALLWSAIRICFHPAEATSIGCDADCASQSASLVDRLSTVSSCCCC